jgi:hypothetical protein
VASRQRGEHHRLVDRVERDFYLLTEPCLCTTTLPSHANQMRTIVPYGAVVAVVLCAGFARAQVADRSADTLHPSGQRDQSAAVGLPRTAVMSQQAVIPQDAFYVARTLTIRSHATRDDAGLPHGLIGAVSGAIVGGGLGYLRMAMYCDNGVECKPAGAILIGAAAGAVVGVVIEYFVRNGQR